jgi:hypothetical protein
MYAAQLHRFHQCRLAINVVKGITGDTSRRLQPDDVVADTSGLRRPLIGMRFPCSESRRRGFLGVGGQLRLSGRGAGTLFRVGVVKLRPAGSADVLPLRFRRLAPFVH